MAYGRDLDLNLLRVFVVVAETGSVTTAASRLYLTQPAVSAALRRLTAAVGSPLFARAGRGIRLTARGENLLATARPHLEAIVHATLSSEPFSPAKSDRTIRIGLSDATDAWLLPPLLRVLANDAPHMRLLVSPVQFRTVGPLLASSTLDCAITVADDLPTSIGRRPLFWGSFTCLFDPRRTKLTKPLTLEKYLRHEHVIVSYNRDFRGIVEDVLGVTRRARVSVPTFLGLGAIVEGSTLLATVPESVARTILADRPRLRAIPLAFTKGIKGSPIELLWRREMEDDGALAFVMSHVERIANEAFGSFAKRGSR